MANTDAYTIFSDLLDDRFYSVELSSTEFALPLATALTPTYIEKLIRVRSGGFDGIGPQSNILLAYMPCNGTITHLAVKTALRSSSPDALFNLRIDGVEVWEDEIDMLTMTAGDTFIEQVVDMSALEGDALRLDLVGLAQIKDTAMILTITPD